MPGGGRTRENSEANVVNGVCFGERVIKTLVSLDRSETIDCGVMSGAKSREIRRQIWK